MNNIFQNLNLMSNISEVVSLNISSTNIRGLNSTKKKQNIIYLMNLKTEVKIILDFHVDESRFNQIRQMHKTRMRDSNKWAVP